MIDTGFCLWYAGFRGKAAFAVPFQDPAKFRHTENWRSLNGVRKLSPGPRGRLFNKVNMKGDTNVAKSESGKTRDPKWYVGNNPGQAGGGKKEFVPSKFVRSELTDQEKEHVKAQNYVWDDIPEHLVALVEGGYKISLTNDKNSNAFAVWLTPSDANNPNHGFTLSARGPTLLAAIAVAIYKHYTKFDGIWPKDDNVVVRDQWG